MRIDVHLQDELAKDPIMKDATLVPFAMGADKTVALVGTGQTEFHPLYLATTGIHNNVWQAHREAVILVTFLAIPKSKLLFQST
jgi:hypothetical protein